MADIAQSIADVKIALNDAEGFLDRFALEYEGLPEAERGYLSGLGLGVKKLQVATSRLVSVVSGLESRLEAVERRGE